MVQTIALCISGYPGSGKSVIKGVCDDLGVPSVELGDIVREQYAQQVGTGGSSEDIGEWMDEKREETKGITAKWAAEEFSDRIESAHRDEYDVLVAISGVRSLFEVAHVEDSFDKAIICFVSSPAMDRYERLTDRGREDEGQFSLADFQERTEREAEWGVETLERYADTTLTNTGTTEEDLEKFEETVEKYVTGIAKEHKLKLTGSGLRSG